MERSRLRALGPGHASCTHRWGSQAAVLLRRAPLPDCLWSVPVSSRREAVACLQGEGNDGLRLYEDLGDYSKVKPIFERILELYNAKHKRMNLVRAQRGSAWAQCACGTGLARNVRRCGEGG